MSAGSAAAGIMDGRQGRNGEERGMEATEKVNAMREIMTGFVERTGLTPGGCAPKRYLWTDAFAVCNFLELFRQTGEERYLQLATALVDQVHTVLGRHRRDDPRQGWISGLAEEEARQHPTIGGLRIGKPLNERVLDEPYDERLEWEQDGQYFHYLTRWMHALNQVGRVTGRADYQRWALELAKTAHARFCYTVPGSGEKRMYWKMSIDLSRPLVPAMGQHDPLDGLVAYLELAATMPEALKGVPEYDLETEIVEAAAMCQGGSWLTEDPLGIGGLLTNGCTMAQLIMLHDLPLMEMLDQTLADAGQGLAAFVASNALEYPTAYRLAFRELGLAIGLEGARIITAMADEPGASLAGSPPLATRLDGLTAHLPVKEQIERFWLKPENQQGRTWQEHVDINSVMLATSLGAGAYLLLGKGDAGGE